MSVANELIVEDTVDDADIVIVDDDTLTLDLISWILQSAQVHFKLFADCIVAKTYLQSATPKLLIVDFHMPWGNGIEFIREIRDFPNLSDTHVYLCSAVTPKLADSQTMQRIGAELLKKQTIFDRSALLSLVDNHR